MGKLTLTLTLLILALAAAGCDVFNDGAETPTDEPEPATAIPTTEPPTPEAAFTPTPDTTSDGGPAGPQGQTTPALLPAPVIDPAAAIPHLAPGTVVTITYIDMQTSTTGWALGRERGPDDHVLRTTDGGETWADVTPPERASTNGDPRKVAHAFFLDSDSSWVTYFREGVSRTGAVFPLVWYTHDGGDTWQHSAYLDISGIVEWFYSPTFLQFVDTQHGWLLIAVGEGMSQSYTLLFRTTDGGATWARIIDSLTSTDLHNCCKTGMVFLDALTGIVTSEQGSYFKPFVTWTRDGGLTWEAKNLPGPENYPDLFLNAYCETHSPNIRSLINHYSKKYEPYVRLGVSCRQNDDEGNATHNHFMYTTLNGGVTWSSYWYPGGRISIYGWDDVKVLGREIYILRYNPVGWQPVKTVFWDGQFSFVRLEHDTSGAQHGWAVARDGDEISFLSTVDGGETWQEIVPVIVGE